MSVPLASPSALSASPSSEVAAPLTVPTIHNAPPTKVPRAHGGLGPNEQWWHEHAGWLEEKGYRLRPRYRENWTPSWTGTKKKWYKCEDGLPNLYAQFIDATKVSDGTVVALKKLFSDRSPREVEITKYFSTAPRDSDARNHCVPLLETLYLPDGVTILLVLPLLRAFNDPPFLSVGEVLEFCRQICEGLDYIHEHNIAHRDCHAGNIMMDPKPLYPNMFHPFSPRMNLNLTAKAKHFTRTQRPVKYYFIDFGISDRYSTRDNTVAAPVHVGGDRTVPEFQTDSPTHNPFATDVYYIGNLFREELLQKYKRLQLLQPLVDKMVRNDPQQRPNSIEVKTELNAILEDCSPHVQRKRLGRKGELFGVFKDVVHTIRSGVSRIRQIPLHSSLPKSLRSRAGSLLSKISCRKP